MEHSTPAKRMENKKRLTELNQEIKKTIRILEEY